MSGVFKNIDPPTGRRVCNPAFGAGGQATFAGWRGDGGSIVRKTPDTALYSTYIRKYFVAATSSQILLRLSNRRTSHVQVSNTPIK